MGFIMYNEKGYLVDPEGNPVYIVGINYVASYICTNFWEDWRPEIIENDLKHISGLGLNAVRIPMHWGFIEPEEGKYNPVIFNRFNIFLGFCKKYGLYIMPWFLVGVATRDYDVPFRGGRPFFTGEMAEVAENHLKHFIKEYMDEEQILFWDICDEPEFYSRHGHGAEQLPYDRKVTARWVKSMYDAIKSVDKNHLVTLGFGHIATANYGMHIKDMAEILDLMVVTCYPFMSSEGCDKYRNNYFIAYNVKFNKLLGKPVFTCEAPGFSNILFSKEVVGRYFKVSLYSNLINGSTGVLPWVYNDFDEKIWHEEPLDKYTIEPYFGIVTIDGELKPSGMELRDFAQFVREVDITKYIFDKAEMAILVPSGYYKGIDSAVKRIYTSFILSKGCSTGVDFIWDDEDLAKYRLIVIPSSNGVTTPVWDKIRKYVQDGGVIYHITDNNFSVNAYYNNLFGVEVETHEKDFGFDKLCVKRNWGSFNKGRQIELIGEKYENYVNVKPVSAEVICEFGDGTPAILKNPYGKGTAYLSVKPLEDGLLDIRNGDFIKNELFEIYDLLIDEANIKRRVKCMDYRVEVGCMENKESGELLVICINHDTESFETQLYLDAEIQGSSGEVKIYDVFKKEYTAAKTNNEGRKYIDMAFGPAGINAYKIGERFI